MSLQNLLKKISEVFNAGKARVLKEKEVRQQKRMSVMRDSFVYRNKREIFIIVFSVMILSLCTVAVTVHCVKGKARQKVASLSKAQPVLETQVIKTENQTVIKNTEKRSGFAKMEDKSGLLDENVLFLLNGAVAYPESGKDQFFADYIEMFSSNNYNCADTNLIMEEYDKIIDQSIKNSCTFNFERRRK